jgi:hypothetical protein
MACDHAWSKLGRGDFQAQTTRGLAVSLAAVSLAGQFMETCGGARTSCGALSAPFASQPPVPGDLSIEDVLRQFGSPKWDHLRTVLGARRGVSPLQQKESPSLGFIAPPEN